MPRLMKTALVTGAGGFVGRVLCGALHRRGVAVRAIVRTSRAGLAADEITSADLSSPSLDMRSLVRDVDAVFHLAAHVHVLDRRGSRDLDRFRAVNRDATERLGRAAADAGVARFVYLSSIGVNGTRTTTRPFTEDDPREPTTPYARSKSEGELALHESVRGSGVTVHVLRAPLVYGPGVEAKFLMLLRLIDRGLPLPFASVRNSRSLLYVENLVDGMLLVAGHPGAGPLYLLADDEAPSTPDLIRKLAAHMGRRPRLVPFPEGAIRFGAAMARRRDLVGPLLDSLVVSTERVRRELGWRPPFRLEEGLRETVRWYGGRR